jgi:hypothetical protein
MSLRMKHLAAALVGLSLLASKAKAEQRKIRADNYCGDGE